MASSAVPIPAGKRKAASSSESASTSTPSSSSSSSPTFSHMSRTPSSKGKEPASSSPVEPISPRRPSLLGSSFTKSEQTVLTRGRSDGPLSLVRSWNSIYGCSVQSTENESQVSFVKSSQGWDWNQDIFLSSRDNYEGSNELEHRQDPVEDIILTDEEADAMLPQ